MTAPMVTMACLMCERVEPPCGWAEGWRLGQRLYDVAGVRVDDWSVCADCDAKRSMGMD